MPRRGKRKRIATNIYEDKTGRAGKWYDAAGKPHEVRYPPNAQLADIRDDLALRKAEHAASGSAFAYPGTLSAAVNDWEPLEQGLASWKERRAELRAWCRAEVQGERVGDLLFDALTERVARTVISQWAAAGVKPKTIRNRLWSLRHLYTITRGPKASTPVDDIQPPAKTKTIPVWIEPAHVLTVYANLLEMERRGILRDAKTRARFMVRASTGKRPSEIMRAEPGDVNLKRREWRVRDGKGGWSEGVYLNDEMLEAWRVFIEADAWGPFETSAQAVTLRSAGWQKGVRPYELRHSVGIALSDAGVDLADISAALGHKDLRTTRTTYVPIRNARMQRASEALEGRFSGWTVAPKPEPKSRRIVARRGTPKTGQ